MKLNYNLFTNESRHMLHAEFDRYDSNTLILANYNDYTDTPSFYAPVTRLCEDFETDSDVELVDEQLYKEAKYLKALSEYGYFDFSELGYKVAGETVILEFKLDVIPKDKGYYIDIDDEEEEDDEYEEDEEIEEDEEVELVKTTYYVELSFQIGDFVEQIEHNIFHKYK